MIGPPMVSKHFKCDLVRLSSPSLSPKDHLKSRPLTSPPPSLLARTKEEVAALSEEEEKLVETFAPVFVYPIFGEEETIFGYQGLEIDVSIPLSLSIPHSFEFQS